MCATALIAAGIGAAGMLGAGAMQAHAASDASSDQMRLAQPSLQAQQYAFPTMQQAIQRYLVPQAGQPSPMLAAEHEQNLSGINKAVGRNMAESSRFWLGNSNVGRGRGEQFRLRAQGTDLTNKENLRYGLAQEGHANAATGNLIDAASTMAGQGSAGLAMADSAINTRLSGQSAMYDAVAGGLGTITGTYQAEQERRRMEELLRASLVGNTSSQRLAMLV